MTAIVGIRCTDGVVLGTDSSVTFGAKQQRTIEQLSDKLHVVDNRVIVATTGWLGHGQRFRDVVEKHCDDDFYKKHKLDGLAVARSLSAAAINDFQETNAPKGQFGALVAYPCRKDIHLCEFDLQHFQPEMKPLDGIWYCSMGGSQPITDPFLGFIRDVFWQEGPPSIKEAQFALIWTLEHAVQVNPGGVKGPISMAVLEEDVDRGFPRARMVDDDELDENRVAIEAAKETLREFPQRLQPEAAGDREVPEPEASRQKDNSS